MDLLTEVHDRAARGLAPRVLGAVVVGAGAVAAADAVLRPNGVGAHLPVVVAAVLVREIVPLGVALMMVSRAGGGGAALQRILGAALAGAALVVVLSAAALVGGSLVSSALQLAPHGPSLPELLEPVTAPLIAVAVGKGAAFAAAVESIRVLHDRRAPRALAPSVIQGLLACAALDAAALALSFIG